MEGGPYIGPTLLKVRGLKPKGPTLPNDSKEGVVLAQF